MSKVLVALLCTIKFQIASEQNSQPNKPVICLFVCLCTHTALFWQGHVTNEKKFKSVFLSTFCMSLINTLFRTSPAEIAAVLD